MNKKLINAVARQLGGIKELKNHASDICNYGAAGGFNGFIYYTDTLAFTKRNHALINELLNNYADDMGVNVLELLSGFNCFKDMNKHEIFDGLMYSKSDNRTTIYNGLAWFALEECARYIAKINKFNTITKRLIKMKIQDLRLALTAVPKKTDIRYYLNGVKITKDTVSASNGHILCLINAGDSFNVIPDQLDNNGHQIPDNYLIIPVETVKDFIKKVGTKSDDQTCCVKLTDCDGLTFHVLSGAGVQCLFTPIDGKYPSFDKILTPVKANNHAENLNKILHQFDWSYVALANDAICKYYGNTTPKRLYSCAECGYFMPDNDIIYVIMPCRN